MQQYDLAKGEAALQAGNKNALYQGILDQCQGMRLKLHGLQTGAIKKAVSVFKDPNNPRMQLRITQIVEDGRLKTTYWMNDSHIWEYCWQRRQAFDEFRKHAATTGTEHMFREYFLSSWMLETYVLLKYGIDLRGSEWNTPGSTEFKQVNWIMDNDSFARRYKLTTYSESRGMPNPFEKIQIDLSQVKWADGLNKAEDQTNVNTSSTSQ